MIRSEQIVFDTERGTITIPLADIYRIKASKEYSTIYSVIGKYMICKHLKYIEELLKGHPYFFRPHKSYIINLNQIKKVMSGKICIYLMNDNFENCVARRKRNLFLETYKLHSAQPLVKYDADS